MRRDSGEGGIDVRGLRFFVDRPKEENGVKQGAWQYWLSEDNEIVAMTRLEREKVFNKLTRRYESFIIE